MTMWEILFNRKEEFKLALLCQQEHSCFGKSPPLSAKNPQLAKKQIQTTISVHKKDPSDDESSLWSEGLRWRTAKQLSIVLREILSINQEIKLSQWREEACRVDQ